MLGRVLRGLFPLRRGERGLALFLYALLTLMVLSDWVGKVGADSLFVKRFGVQYIPVMYIVTPLVMLATSAFIFSVVGRVRRRTLLFAYTAIVTVLSVLIQLALPLGGAILPIAYVFAHGVKETIYLLFWMYAGNLYDSEQSARLFPIFAGAVLIGKIVGGPVAVALADTIHSDSLIGAQAIGFSLCLILLVVYWKRLPEGPASQPAERPQGPRESLRQSVGGYRAVASDPLMRVFGIGVFFWYFLMQSGSYLYLVGLDASSQLGSLRSSEDLFVQLYASVYTTSSIAALAVQTFLTGALLRRFGVASLLFVLPLWYLGAYGGALVSFGLVAAVAIQLGERVVVPAVHRPASELIFSQVAARIRPRARAFLSGGVNALGNIAAALLLLGAAAAGLDARVILAIAAVFSLVFVLNTAALRVTLGRRIGENLRAEDASLRRNALQMLRSEGANVPIAALRRALAVASADVEDGVRTALVRRKGARVSK